MLILTPKTSLILDCFTIVRNDVQKSVIARWLLSVVEVNEAIWGKN